MGKYSYGNEYILEIGGLTICKVNLTTAVLSKRALGIS